MLEEINRSLFHGINKFAGYNPMLDATARVIAEYLPFLFILVVLYYWFSKKEDSSKVRLLLVGYSVLLALSINFLITLFYFHPRPFMVRIGKLLVQHGHETSFPSDHATFMFSIAFAFITFNEFRKTGIILTLLALFGGTTRVFVGIHFPFDIAGSIGVSLISAKIVSASENMLTPMNKRLVKFYKDVLYRLKYLRSK